jgi:hypothetical protein
MKYSWIKTRFATWITRKHVRGLCLFNLPYLITHMAYLCSQQTPKVQIKYFLFHWSIYRLFVLNWVWKSDSFQMKYISKCLPNIKHGSTKSAFMTWITRNDVYGKSLIHLSYLITLMAYLCSQRTPKFQIKCLMFACSIYGLFVLNRGWKRDSLQKVIFICLLDMKHIWTYNSFWDVNNNKWRIRFKFIYPILFNKSEGLPVLTTDTKCPNQVFYVWFVDLHTICAK